MGITMSGCGCSKETPCEDKKSQQENHPSIAEASNSKNCDNTPSCCGEEEEEKSSSPCCNTSNYNTPGKLDQKIVVKKIE